MFDEMMEKEEKWNLKFFLDSRPDMAAKLRGTGSSSSSGSSMKTTQSLPELPKLTMVNGKPVPSQLNRRIQYRRHDFGKLYADTPTWQQ